MLFGNKTRGTNSSANKRRLSRGVTDLNPIPPGLFEGGLAWGGGGGGGGGRKVPAAYNSKTINDNEMKFGGVVKDH